MFPNFELCEVRRAFKLEKALFFIISIEAAVSQNTFGFDTTFPFVLNVRLSMYLLEEIFHLKMLDVPKYVFPREIW